MVSTRHIIELTLNLVNLLVYVLYGIAVITWITGIDITKVITIPPVEVIENILKQYPEVFNALSLGLLAIVTIDQIAVGMIFRQRGIPPPRYVFASSLATFSISTVLLIFMRGTPLWPFFIYFIIVSALALIHSLAILTGKMKEILPKPPQAQALFQDEFLDSWEWLGSENIYPEPRRKRRVLREW